jgi:hypothetical protein
MVAYQSLDEAGQRASARYVDLQLDLVTYKSGTPIARYGGRWDRRKRDYTGDAARSRVVELHGVQIAAAREYDRWLQAYLDGVDPEVNDRIKEIIEGNLEVPDDLKDKIGTHELLLTGGRRSGKTSVAELLGVATSVAVVNALVWTVTPAEQFHEEPREVLQALMPTAWYVYLGWPHFTFSLPNGSQHVLRSGHAAGNLKKGKADCVIVNEAQQVKKESYENARGGTLDLGGIAICAANPPRVGDHMWIASAVADTDDGERMACKHFFVDPLENPHINKSMLLVERSKMSEYDFETQIRGKILGVPDAAFYTWDRRENERRPPDFGKITTAFLEEHEGGRRLDQLWVVDVQSYPWIAALRFEIYRDPYPPSRAGDRPGILWGVDEIALERGDELDVAGEMKRRGADPDRTMIIIDASCFWQQMIRSKERQREEYKGKSSAFIFKSAGFSYVVRPDRKMKTNPDVDDRYRAANARICVGTGERRLFLDPIGCPTACESVRMLRTDDRGRAKTNVRAAHFGDCVGYGVWRFHPSRSIGGVGPINVIPQEPR